MEQSNEIRDLVSDHFLTSGGEGGGSFNLYTWVFKKIIQWSFIHSRQLLNSVPEVKCHKVQISLKKSLNQPESIYNVRTCVCIHEIYTPTLKMTITSSVMHGTALSVHMKALSTTCSHHEGHSRNQVFISAHLGAEATGGKAGWTVLIITISCFYCWIWIYCWIYIPNEIPLYSQLWTGNKIWAHTLRTIEWLGYREFC